MHVLIIFPAIMRLKTKIFVQFKTEESTEFYYIRTGIAQENRRKRIGEMERKREGSRKNDEGNENFIAGESPEKDRKMERKRKRSRNER